MLQCEAQRKVRRQPRRNASVLNGHIMAVMTIIAVMTIMAVISIMAEIAFLTNWTFYKAWTPDLEGD